MKNNIKRVKVNNNMIGYRKKITSQDGEDGIIEEIFKRLGVVKGTCMEFGAWDGKHLSNTWNLWFNRGWDSVLIEGDIRKFKNLEKEYKEWKNLILINKYVSIEGENSLDNILLKTDVPKDFDLLSIDIDGDDYHVWKNFNEYSPKIVVIEYNPSIPPNMELIDTPTSHNFAASALSLLKLAQEKGYDLIACTQTNMFFIRKELFNKLNIEQVKLEQVFQYDHIRYIIGSYQGRVFMSNSAKPGHIKTNGFSSFRSFLPAEIPPEYKKSLTPVFVCEISRLKNNRFFTFLILAFAKCLKIFRII